MVRRHARTVRRTVLVAKQKDFAVRHPTGARQKGIARRPDSPDRVDLHSYTHKPKPSWLRLPATLRKVLGVAFSSTHSEPDYVL